MSDKCWTCGHGDPNCICGGTGRHSDEVDNLRSQLAAERERFDWYLGAGIKSGFLDTYLQGVREGWTPDQWRASIDAQRKLLEAK